MADELRPTSIAHPHLPHNGIRIPAWAITAVVVIVVVLTTGFSFGRTWTDTQHSLRDMDTRLCRIEQALDIPLWPSCTEPRSDR